ncbi:hypothetical protein [Acidihalobacter prosperus]|uniref:Uncharacterized protein n=1 Tax=Acidihalobacter prosperus TaxID=160660 RepID=A0A1A6C556_9GAMM|nr:hypothetical protein [Acidihalobacter prosperus]OBS09693.1 hypothetical protein Thpro_022021 [Acidihalobacter prosperus]
MSTALDAHLEAATRQTANNHRNRYLQKSDTLADVHVVLDISRDRHGRAIHC